MAPEPVQRFPPSKSKYLDKGANIATMYSKQVASLSDDSKANAVIEEAAATLPEESEEMIEMGVRVNQVYYHNGRRLMEKERLDGNLANRSKQAALYLTYADLRIEELEKELYKVKQTLYDLPDEFEVRKRRRLHPVYQHLLKRSSPSQFRLSKSSFDTRREDRAALEVLIVEHLERKQHTIQPGLSRRPTGVESDQVNVRWSPERLRIRSRPLIIHLQSVTATQLSDNLSVPEKDTRETSLVFLRPFKFFVMFETEIRQSVSDLESAIQNQRQDKQKHKQRYEKQKQDTSSTGVPPHPKRLLVEEPEFDDRDLLEDLKVMIKFMDEELRPIFDLRQRIKEGTADLIAYADLWHLFRRGEFVLLQSDPTHAYKVLQFTGGREPLIDRINENDEKPKSVEGFSVDCLSVQSNGSSYVPRLTTVSILPYLGRAPIKSLAAYPMRFDPDEAAKRDRFMDQGRQYLQLTMQFYAHKNILGKTLDEPSHDLDAQTGGLQSPSTSGSVGSGIDLVQGKGTGLILLLHGAPSVGKTSTAECVADTTRRPLFPVTCGDIGETAHEVGQQLQHNFLLAHKWGCVLLLDEADVFLSRRTRTDLRHNAVTSVFLRSLEYYAGILFLTTNRVGHMDPAFKSRINMSLLYHPFNLKSTVRLYKTFIDRTRAEQKKRGPPHFKINGEEILAFAKENYRGMKKEDLGVWNGRQIRNAFQAAISLAEHEYLKKLVDGRYPAKKSLPELGRTQLTTIANQSKDFEQYLKVTLGKDEGDMAYEEQARADQFSVNTEPKVKKQRAAGYGMSSSLTRSGPKTRKKGKGNARVPLVTSSEDEDDEISPSDDDEGDEGEGEDKDSDSTGQTRGNHSDDSDSVEDKVKAILELMLKQKQKKKGKK